MAIILVRARTARPVGEELMMTTARMMIKEMATTNKVWVKRFSDT
jgi:hypothetical protein